MRVIKTNHRNSQRAPDLQCFPSELIRIGGFDDIRPFAFQDFFDCAQI